MFYIHCMASNLTDKSILLVISGGIAAYKSLALIRLLRQAGAHVRCILTAGGAQFITPLSVAALSEEQVYTDLWSLKDETEMGHIRLSREADLIVVAPASANIIAQITYGLADDLAATVLLASTTPILLAPAMNHAMWRNAATQENMAKLRARGVMTVGPEEGDMACGEYGMGRMAEPEEILGAILRHMDSRCLNLLRPAGFADRGDDKSLEGLKALVTAGPTMEPIDPVRYIGNHSSGVQGYAIAAALAKAGAEVTLVSGPVDSSVVSRFLPPHPSLRDSLSPRGEGALEVVSVQTAQEMLKACEGALPADIAICAAAVADWRVEASAQKIKKGGAAPVLSLIENPDILKTLSAHKMRPKLVIGFALESENVIGNAKAKLKRKGCDWIVANAAGHFGDVENAVSLVTEDGVEDWPRMGKREIAAKIVERIVRDFSTVSSFAKAKDP